MAKSVDEINEKIKTGKVVVITADEAVEMRRENSYAEISRKVDIVTTGTFAPMCSSGAYFNLGHSVPRIKIHRATLNGVPAYCGYAAVDLIIGASELPEDDPLNQVYPGEFKYGGGHVIEDLVAGKEVFLEATSYSTDCYPSRKWDKTINLSDLPMANLLNLRNSYQNYNVAVNLSERIIYTYMGLLKPKLGNANFCSAGKLSPLFKDPYYRTIGIGTRIFLGGGFGYVIWQGTQHAPDKARNESGVPIEGAGTLATIGDLKSMDQRWLTGCSFQGYGATLSVGIGIPIPIIDEDQARFASIDDHEISASVVDYGNDYPYGTGRVICTTNYGDLKRGEIEVMGKTVKSTPLSSYYKAREIAVILKELISEGKFELTKAVQLLPCAERDRIYGTSLL